MTRWGVINQGPSLSKQSTSHEHTSMERDWSSSCVCSCTEVCACRADVSAVICFLQTENNLFFYLHEEREKSDPIISGHSRCILMPAVNWYTWAVSLCLDHSKQMLMQGLSLWRYNQLYQPYQWNHICRALLVLSQRKRAQWAPEKNDWHDKNDKTVFKKKRATVSQQDTVETRQRETSERKKLEEKKKNGWRKNSRAKWSTLKRCH